MPAAQQPYVSWWGSSFPTTVYPATFNLAAGNRFRLLAAGRIVGCRVAQNGSSANSLGVCVLNLPTGSGMYAAAARQKKFANAASYPVWRNYYFHPFVRVAVNQDVQIFVRNQQLTVLHTPGLMTAADIDHGVIRALQDGGTATTFNGSVSSASSFAPNLTNSGGLFGVDLLFLPD